MSFFHRNKSQQKQSGSRDCEDGIAAADGSAAWYATSTAAAPSSSSFHDEFHFGTTANNGGNDGVSPTATTTTPSKNNDSIFSSNWAQERSAQQIDLENEVLRNTSMKGGDQVESSNGGYCQSTLIILIKGLHIFNVMLGMAMLVYGILVQQHGKQQQQQQFDHSLDSFDVESSSASSSRSSITASSLQQSSVEQRPPQPEDDAATQQQAMAAVLFCLMLGSIHLLTSGVGSFSLFFCNNIKVGYIMSAWAGPYLTIIYISILVALLFDSDGFILYLEEHAPVMYLTSNFVENATRIFLPVAYTFLAVLGTFESMRYCVLMNMHKDLVAREELDAYIPRSSQSIISSSSSSRSARRNKVSASSTLTQALLQESIDAETVRSNNSSSVDPNWWEN